MSEQENEAPVVEQLRGLGAGFRFRKSGLCHTVDLSQATGTVDDSIAQRIAQLTRVAVVNLSGTAITSDALAAFAGLEKLQSLDLSDTTIGDEALPHFKPLAGRVRILVLTNTQVSADAIKEIRKQMINTRIIQLS